MKLPANIITLFACTSMLLFSVACSSKPDSEKNIRSSASDTSAAATFKRFTSVDIALRESSADSVYELDLSRKQLNELPETLLGLKNLRYLDLSVNQFKQVPSELISLQNLEELDLSNNQITSLPDDLHKLKRLRKLHLRYNQFKKIPAVIVELAMNGQLEFLDFEGNQLSEEEILKLQEVLQGDHN